MFINKMFKVFAFLFLVSNASYGQDSILIKMLENQQEENIKLSKENDKCREKLLELKDDKKSLEIQNRDLGKRLKQTQNSLREYKKLVGVLNEEIEAQDIQINSLNQIILEKDFVIDQLNVIIDRMEDTLVMLRGDVDVLKRLLFEKSLRITAFEKKGILRNEFENKGEMKDNKFKARQLRKIQIEFYYHDNLSKGREDFYFSILHNGKKMNQFKDLELPVLHGTCDKYFLVDRADFESGKKYFVEIYRSLDDNPKALVARYKFNPN